MKKGPGEASPTRGGPDRPERPEPDAAWNAAEWAYSALVADSIVPFFGPELSRDDWIRQLREILDEYPAFYPALFHLGALEAKAGRTDEARRLLLEGADRMAEREPSPDAEEVEALDGIVEPLEAGLRYDLARDLLERLSRHYPSEAYYHSELGAALVFLGERDEAVRRFRKALALEPENHRHHANLGWACLEAGRLEDARAQLERSLALDPDDPVTLGNRDVLRFLEAEGGTLEDYLVRPLDHEELDRLEAESEATGDFGELGRTVGKWNHARLEAWKRELCRGSDLPEEAELYRSVRAFLQFVEEVSHDAHTLYEDVDLLRFRFEPLMHTFILRMADADEEIIEEVCAGLLSFHGHLARRGVASWEAVAELRTGVLAMKPTLVSKAERYAEIRHDSSVPEHEKERIRGELFGRDRSL